MKKRSEKRIIKSLLVQMNQNGFEQMGVTANISRNGMCIATTEIFPTQSELTIAIATADNIYTVKGLVVWSLEKDAALAKDILAGIGIKIKETGSGYCNYIEGLGKKKLFWRNLLTRKSN
jgi:hypothetical protein